MKKPLPEKISERRKALGLTQEKLGSLLGVSPQAVSKWENSDCLPDLLLIPQLCEALQIPADDLLEVPPPTSSSTGTALVSAADIRIRSKKGLALSVAGEAMVQTIRQADPAALGDMLALLADEHALRIFQALSFTAIGFEAEIAARCGLPAEAAREALLRLLRMELCQCAPEGYVLGSNAYLAYAVLSAAWLASPEGRADITSITISYSTSS